MQNTQLFSLGLALALTAIVSNTTFCPQITQAKTSKNSASSIGQKKIPETAHDYWNECARRGYHYIWFQDEMPLKVFIRPGKQEDGWSYKHDQLFKKAFIEMTSASKGKIKFKFVNQKPFDIECTYRPATAYEPHRDALAYTSISHEKHHITSADITVFTNKPQFERLETFYMTALHEIGHAVGLNHSGTPEDIMFKCAATNCFRTTYSPRDQKTIEKMYAFKPPKDELVELEIHRIKKMANDGLKPNIKDLYQSQRDKYTDKIVGLFKNRLKPTLYTANSTPQLNNCTVKFLVDRRGNLYGQHIEKQSSNNDFDHRVLTALVLLEPLPEIEGLKLTEVVEMHLQVNSNGEIQDLMERHSRPLELAALTPVVDETSKESFAKLAKLKRLSAIALGEIPPDREQNNQYWRRSISEIALKAGDKLNLPEGSRLELSMNLNQDGYVESLDIVWSSGCWGVDEEAKKLLRARSPYPRPPSKTANTRNILVTFKNNGK